MGTRLLPFLVILVSQIPIPLTEAATDSQDRIFLEKSLHFEPLVSTPVELLDGSKREVQISGRQALTVVFSRPVIPLGADFGKADSFGGKVPFSLSCPDLNLGRFRWVTTSIARLDPKVDWPTDLDCDFIFNTELTTFDGAPLKLTMRPKVKLSTTPLSMEVQRVLSELASNATGAFWSADIGLPDDVLPEVPPDGKIELVFNYPVSIQMLQSAMKLEPEIPSSELYFSKCLGYFRPPPFFPRGSSSAGGNSDVTNLEDETCVSVEIRGSLEIDTGYKLILPAGSKYNNLSAPIEKDLTVRFGGLRRFRVPIKQDFQDKKKPGERVWNGVRYRRLDAWLPHGLNSSTPIEELADQIQLCEFSAPWSSDDDKSCKEVNVRSVSILKKGKIRLHTPGLEPGKRYNLKFRDADGVLDYFGLPLKASEGSFWTEAAGSIFEGPSLNSRVAIFGKSALPDVWPFLMRGQMDGRESAALWSLDIRTDDDVEWLVKIMTDSTLKLDTKEGLGEPDQLVRPDGSFEASVKSASFDKNKKVHISHTCCRQLYSPKKLVSSNVQLILQTDIMASWVVTSDREAMVWVTRAGGDGVLTGPEPRAKAYIFFTSYRSLPVLGGTCTTGDEGWCIIGLRNSLDMRRNRQAFGVVRDDEGNLVYTPNIGISLRLQRPIPVSGALLVDRALVRPDEKLYVTGYVQQASRTGKTEVPSSRTGVLAIEPSWTRNRDDSVNPRFNITLSEDYGSVHVEVDVPSDVQIGQYQAVLYLQRTASSRKEENLDPVQSMSMMTGGRRGLNSDFAVTSVAPGPTAVPLMEDLQRVVSTQITVADPRPPTAELFLKTSSWVKPQGSISVTVQAKSFLGTQVSAAPLTLTWKAPKAEGLLELETDAEGSAQATIDLASLKANNATVAGDRVSVNVEWIGPTRERIVRTSSVRVEEGSLRVQLVRDLETSIPETQFSPMAKVYSNEDDSEKQGIPVSVTLRPANTSDLDNACNVEDSCSILSGSLPPTCQLQLKCIGNFELDACVEDEGGSKSCASLIIGKNSTQWEQSPLVAFEEPRLFTKSSKYLLGDTAELFFQNPWKEADALLAWKNAFNPIKTKLLGKIPTGLNKVKLALDDGCFGGCSLGVLIAVPHVGTPDEWGPSNVPVSKLFDPRSPHTHFMEVALDVQKDRSLDLILDLTTEAPNAGDIVISAPGQNLEVKAVVQNGGVATSEAEVTFVAVDKAVLELMPNPLRNLSQSLELDLSGNMRYMDMNGNRVHPNAVDAVFDALLRRLKLDPWVGIDTRVLPQRYFFSDFGSRSPVDISDDDFFAQYSTDITVMPNEFGVCNGPMCPIFASPVMMGMPEADLGGANQAAFAARPISKALPNAQADESSGSGANEGSPRVAADFEPTAFYGVALTGQNGEATIDFAAPMKLSSYVVRAYATSKATAGYGQAESQLIVRRLLSLTASIPRFVRIGDKFMAGVIVTVSDGKEQPITASVRCKVIDPNDESSVAPITLLSQEESSATFGEKQQIEVRFLFSAKALGSGSLEFSADDGQGASDALLLEIPVIAINDEVHVATSFALRPNSSNASGVTRQEGLELPEAVEGSGEIDITAGVAHLPAIRNLYESLPLDARDEPAGYDAVLKILLPSIYTDYQKTLSENEGNQAAKQLMDLTTDRLGLRARIPDSIVSRTIDRADIILNAWAFWTLRNSKPPPGVNSWSSLEELLPRWQRAAARQIVEDVSQAREQQRFDGINNNWTRKYSDFYTLAWARLLVGANWKPEESNSCFRSVGQSLEKICASAEVIEDLSLERQVRNASGLNTKLLTALAIQESSSMAFEEYLTKVADEVVSTARIQGRTAYIAVAEGAQSAAGLETQALALLFLARLSRTSEAAIIQKLAAYVASEDKKLGLPWPASLVLRNSPQAIGLAMFALKEYDLLTGSTTPNLDLSVKVNSTLLLEASFTKDTEPLASRTTPWRGLPEPRGPVDVHANGVGEVSVSASLSFIPAKMLPFPTYRGIWVESTVREEDAVSGEAKGPALEAVPLGSVVVITVQVITPDDLGSVAVEVAMPGGLEPIDPNVAADQGGLICPLSFWGVSRRSWWWPVCPVQRTRPEEVGFNYVRLGAGTHTIDFKAIATTEGNWTAPPVKAFVESQPEVMGMTAGGKFEVCSFSCESRQANSLADMRAKPCGPLSNPCNSNGICDISRGSCSCFEGFSGEECGQVSPV